MFTVIVKFYALQNKKQTKNNCFNENDENIERLKTNIN